LPKADYGTPGQRIKLIGVRRKIAEHLVHAKHTAPHYSYVDECDVTDLVRLREQLRGTFAAKGVKLTYLPFFVKAVVASLKEVPIVNASLDDEAAEIVLHDRYHIGIATATPAGLIVPVVRDADQKDLVQIAREIERLTDEARTGKPRLDEIRGGTFTITSIGGLGGLISTPILNHPEVGILGVGKFIKRPVYDAAGNIKPADLVYLSFTFDHRVLDGAVGAVFANAVIQRLQTPAALLLE
jgi:pyruvate dehydrogenase E2 component (dihydrolipoamide acetyltransferase)/2-oxoisovalerate dehydrogenase E2 component (dihydrolipoyl transacylase)